MTILPCMSNSLAFLREDGVTADAVDFQVFRLRDGTTAIRIGRNILFFDEGGHFHGNEVRAKAEGISKEEGEKIADLFKAQTFGTTPHVPHHMPDSPGHEDETRAWKKRD